MATKLSNFLNSTLATGLDSAAVIATVQGPGVAIPLDSNTTGSFIKRMTPGNGILMSNHNGKGVNATVKIDSSVIPTLSNTKTFTNKTINLTNNTLTGTLAQFNAAISDGSIPGTATEDTLTNKTLTAPIINLDGSNTGGTPGITGPGTISQISSLGLRDQTATGQDTFIASNSSTTLTADRTITLDVHNADRTIEMKGNLDISGDFITSGDNNITLTTTGATNVTLPTSGIIPNTAGTIQVARELESDRAFSLTGEITASAVQFDGTGNVALNTTIANKSQADSATTIVERDANADITARAFQTPYGEVIDSAGNWKGLATGFKGEQGDKGQKGDTGQKGEIGIGVKGAQGEKGQKGDTGAAGSNGDKGQKGEKGEVGEKGATGATGTTGLTGAKGQKGEVGQKGDTGQKGETGATGAKGQKGEVGDKGATGEKGATGAKGDKGQKGQAGQFGGKTVNYAFSTTTTDADPGSGNLRFNNATVANVTKFFIDDADTNGTDIQSFLRTIDDSTSTIKGHVRVANKLDASDYAIFTISGLTEATGYFKVDVSYVSGPGSFANTEDVIMTFARTGDAGDKGQKGEVGGSGDVGIKGEPGVKGQKGEAGATGQKGEVGQKGDTGATGSTGATGAKGATGSTGSAGAKGQKGEVGATGGTGDKGQKGATGATGGAGAKGQKGEVGATGGTGSTGSTGAKGQKGQKGDRASSIASSSAPASPSSGDFWFDDETGALYIYYNDGNSSQWVQFNQAVLADGSITSAKFFSSTSLSVFNSSGTALRTIYGAGS